MVTQHPIAEALEQDPVVAPLPVPSRKKSESVCQRWQTVCRQTLFPTAKCLPGVSAGRHFGTSSDMGVSAADALQWGKVSAARGSIAGRRFAVGKSVCRQTLLADTPLTLGAPKCLPAEGKVSAGRHFQAWQTLSDLFLDGAGRDCSPLLALALWSVPRTR